MTKVHSIRIATRASALAMWQAHHVSALFNTAGVTNVELVEVSTIGDRDQSEPLSALSTSIDGGGTGLFTREVQRAVLDGRADVAVHSLKDLPTEMTPGLSLSGIPSRVRRFDRLVFPASFSDAPSLDALPSNARVGTGALRRQAQLLYLRSDLELAEIRGNIDTRLKKLDEGQYDAILLAAAGLDRLGFENWPSVELAPPTMWPAVGQAALGIECRTDDLKTKAVLETLSDSVARSEVTAERSLLKTLRAGCHAPVGALARATKTRVILEGVVLSPDGRDRVLAASSGTCPVSVGQRVAELLVAQGADRFLGTVASYVKRS